MRREWTVFILCIILFSTCSKGKTYIVVETEFGDMKFELYDSTPKHKKNMIKLVKEGFYTDLLFHRIIKGFMVQGGDPDSKTAGPDAVLGGGDLPYTIEQEIGAPHFKGVLAAARTGDQANPLKASSATQFYIVQGTPQNDASLGNVEHSKGIKYLPAQIEKYKSIGGTPQLDMEYTVFGEIVEGMDIIDILASVPTRQYDRPAKDIKFSVRLSKN